MGYLLALLIAAALWASVFYYAPKLRREMLIIGILIAPFALLDYFAIPSYWQPETLFNLPVGVEGLAFTFCISGIAAVIYELFTGRAQPAKKIDWERLRYLAIPTVISLLAWWVAGYNVMYFVILTAALNAVIIIYLKPRLLWNSLVSAVLFSLVYTSCLYIWLWLSPGSQSWWNDVHMIYLLGINLPLEEVLFSLGIGAFVGPLYEFLLDGA